MDNSIFDLKEYGRIVITVKDVMDKRGMTRNKVANLTGLVFNSVNRYYKNAPITSVDLDILAKLCFVLRCEIGDVLKYERPDNE